MKNCKCAELGIPDHLHQLDRPIDNHFLQSELIYRRFPCLDTNAKKTLVDGKLSASVFSTHKMSLNRQKYSNEPSDVLYNINSKEHFINDGIFSLTVVNVNDFSEPSPNDHNKLYTLKLLHKPDECMYSHCEIFVGFDGELLDDLERPKSVKTAIKDHYRLIADVIVEPTCV